MKDRKRVILYFAAVILFSMSCNFAHPVTPALFKKLQLPDYMFGVALASMYFGNFLFSPFWAKIVGIWSSRRVLMVSCLGYGIGQLIFANCTSILSVIIVRFLTGIFVGGGFVGMLTYVVNTAPDEAARSRFLVTSATLEGVFNSVGYFIGGMLGEIGIITAVLVQAVCLFGTGLFFRLVCTDDVKTAGTREKVTIGLRDIDPTHAFAQGMPLLKCAIGLLMIVCALRAFSQTCFDQTFNYYVTDQIGLSTGYNGAFKGTMGLVTLLANATLCRQLIRKTDTGKSVSVVFAGCAVFMAVILLTKAVAPFLVMCILFFALSAVTTPLLQDLVADAAEREGRDSNMVMGFYNALKNSGNIVGALTAGFTYLAAPRAPFVCCMAGMLIACVCAVIYAGKRRRSQN